VPAYQLAGDAESVADYVQRYDREIRVVDRALGEVLDFLNARGLAADTLLLFTADHGESLGENDYFFEHGWFVGEGSLRVPLLIKPAGADAPGTTIEIPVSQLDVAFTILTAAGSDAGDVRGRDLRSGTLEPHPIVFTNAATYPERFVGVRDGHWKYVRRTAVAASEGDLHDVEGPERLYDLAADSGEAIDLAGTRPDKLADMRDLLARAQSTDRPAVRAAATPAPISSADRARLRALGYVE
jgi:arylsulfatase A-like enzyme